MFMLMCGIAVGISCSIQYVEDIIYGKKLNVLYKTYLFQYYSLSNEYRNKKDPYSGGGQAPKDAHGY